MNDQTERTTTYEHREPEPVIVELGGARGPHPGPGQGQPEDKRRAYNCA